MIFLILCGIFVICVLKLYLNLKPILNVQKKTNHCNWAVFKLLGCDAYNAYEIFQNVMKGHGSYMLGEKFTVVIEDLDDLKTIFYAEETFEKSYPYKFFFKNGLFTDVGEKYKLQRKAISPLFNPSSIRSFIPITNEKVDEFLNSFSGNIEGKKIDARVLTFNFTTNTVFKTLFGKQKHLSDETVESMRHTGEEFTCLASSRMFKPWLYSESIYKFSKLSKKIFKLKEKLFLKDLQIDFHEIYDNNHNICNTLNFIEKIEPLSFFDLMKKVPLPYEEFLEATIFFMGASAETTSSTLANILHLLGMYQDVQIKLYDELKSVLKSEKDYVQEDEMSKMTYLDLVIKESLRLLPVAIMQGRTATKSLKLKKYLLPAGTSTNINTLIIHTDPKYWGEDALEFRPERFLEDHFHNMHPFAYFPFSHGPRMCPGMKYAQMTMKIFLSRFLMKYKVSSPLTYKELKFIFGLTLKTKQDPILFFEKRNK